MDAKSDILSPVAVSIFATVKSQRVAWWCHHWGVHIVDNMSNFYYIFIPKILIFARNTKPLPFYSENSTMIVVKHWWPETTPSSIAGSW